VPGQQLRVPAPRVLRVELARRVLVLLVQLVVRVLEPLL
jgi:hypothetical protein